MFDMRHSKVVRWLAIRIALLPVLFVLASGASYLVVYGIGPGPSYACLSRGCPEGDESRGVDGSLLTDYADWLGHAVRGDLGEDLFPLGSVSGQAFDGLPATIELTLLSIMFSLVVGLPLGLASARWQLSNAHSIALAGLLAVSAVPVFLTSTLALILPSVWWDYAPPFSGVAESLVQHPWDHIRQFAPSAGIVALSVVAPATLTVRSRLLRARLDRRGVAAAAMHAAAAVLPAVVVAVIFIELAWAIPGLGWIQFSRVTRGFLPTAQAATTLLVFGVLALRLFLTVEDGERSQRVERAPAWHAMLRSPALLVGGAIVVAFILIGLCGLWLAPHDPRAVSPEGSQGASWEHLLGTDRLGRDVLSRVLAGARQPMVLSIGGVLLGYLPGTVVGAGLGGVRNGHKVGAAIGWLAGAPALLLAVPVVYNTRGDFGSAMAFVGAFAFLMGTGVGSCAPFVRSAPRSETLRGIAVHAIPGILDAMVFAVLLHVMLGFLGLRIEPDLTLGWGHDVAQARQTLPMHYWALLPPGLAIAVVLFGLRLCAESFRDLAREAGQIGEADPSPSP